MYKVLTRAVSGTEVLNKRLVHPIFFLLLLKSSQSNVRCYENTQSLSQQYLFNGTCCVPGTSLEARDRAVSKSKCLPSWGLRSSDQRRESSYI